MTGLFLLCWLWVGRFLCSHTMCIVVRIWIRCTSSISASHDELVVGLLLFALPVCFNNYPRFRFSISLVVHRQPYLEMLGFRHDRFLDCRILHVGIPLVYAMLYYLPHYLSFIIQQLSVLVLRINPFMLYRYILLSSLHLLNFVWNNWYLDCSTKMISRFTL